MWSNYVIFYIFLMCFNLNFLLEQYLNEMIVKMDCKNMI